MKVGIGIACDGFSIIVDDKRFWFSQEEENVGDLLKRMFTQLGALESDIEILEEY